MPFVHAYVVSPFTVLSSTVAEREADIMLHSVNRSRLDPIRDEADECG